MVTPTSIEVVREPYTADLWYHLEWSREVNNRKEIEEISDILLFLHRNG